MSAALNEPSWIGARSSSTRLGTALGNAVRVASPALLFGVRLWASVCLALYIAFWLELDNAYWAGTSAAVVCQPGLGAACQAIAGLWSLTLPAGLALVALAMAFAVTGEGAQAQPFILRFLAGTNPQRAGSHRASASGTASNVGRPQ